MKWHRPEYFFSIRLVKIIINSSPHETVLVKIWATLIEFLAIKICHLVSTTTFLKASLNEDCCNQECQSFYNGETCWQTFAVFAKLLFVCNSLLFHVTRCLIVMAGTLPVDSNSTIPNSLWGREWCFWSCDIWGTKCSDDLEIHTSL
jgi:hypothetical protein